MLTFFLAHLCQPAIREWERKTAISTWIIMNLNLIFHQWLTLLLCNLTSGGMKTEQKNNTKSEWRSSLELNGGKKQNHTPLLHLFNMWTGYNAYENEIGNIWLLLIMRIFLSHSHSISWESKFNGWMKFECTSYDLGP